jgi:ABC-type sugar transport system ATPase subunit
VEKRFGGIVALRAGNLEVAPGEVHLLMGENGAGKSTLMKIVAGMQQRDGGQMLWRDRSVSFSSPVEAAREGIAMVHQESLLAPHLSVAENLFLGREGRSPFGWVGRRGMTARAAEVIAEHGFPLRAQQLVSELSPAGRQLVEICRAILHSTRLLIFDEPTSALSEHESQEVFQIVRGLKERGAGVIYITHRLEELRSVGDRITILRDGATVHSGPLSGIAREEMIRHMVGREVTSLYRREPLTPGPERLRIESLHCPPMLRGVSLSVRQGEIVGLGGLIGAGRTELCRAIFGVDRLATGRIWIDGKVTAIRSPRQAVAAGIALIPEDRQRTGLARDLSVPHNLTLASLKGLSRFGLLDAKRGEVTAQQQIEQLRIKTSGAAQQAGRLSGGNQQKVVIGKWLARGAQVFLFDEPTRGIDVAAKVEVFELMDRLARQGAAILMVSSELPELLQVADRVLVMRQGQIVAELPKTTTQEEIMHHASIEEAS